MEERYYSLREAANTLGIKVRTAREWIRAGKLKAIKYDCSNRWFVAESEIRRLKHGDESC